MSVETASIVAAAERVLSRTFGRKVELGDVDRLSDDDRRNLLLRCRDFSGKSPASVIIKKVVGDAYDPADASSWDTQRFTSDRAGAEFLSAVLPAPLTPRFFSGDDAAGFFILEDLGEHRSLVEPLLDGDAGSAERALLAFSACLGSLHAGTVGLSATFERVLGDSSRHLGIFSQPFNGFRERAIHLQARLEEMGLHAEAGLSSEIQAVITAIESPGPFLSYIHGDPCPDNVFWNGHELRLIDFEFGGFGHALLDAACGRMQFPSCWCANRLPSDLVSRMETAYRAELVEGCPEAQDDRMFESALVKLCGYWLLTSLSRHLTNAMDADRTWGIATMCQRVLARLEAFAATSEKFDELPALAAMAVRLLERLRQAWPDVSPLPLYPAFNRQSS